MYSSLVELGIVERITFRVSEDPPFSITVTSAIHYANYIYSSRGSSRSYSYTCSGSENQLLNCSTTARSCSHRYYWWGRNTVGVRCYSKCILVATLITGIYQAV